MSSRFTADAACLSSSVSQTTIPSIVGLGSKRKEGRGERRRVESNTPRGASDTTIQTLNDLVNWSSMAPASDPLRKAYEETKALLGRGRLVRPPVTSAEKRNTIRDMVALAEGPQDVLFEFCALFAVELAKEPVPPDAEMLDEVPELAEPAFQRARKKWLGVLKNVRKMPVPKRGRPASGRAEVLDRLARELVRHPQVAKGLKEEANRAAAEVAVRVRGGKIETYLREIQMARKKSR